MRRFGRLRGPLAHRNFQLLVGCDVTSMIGSAMALVAVPFAVLKSGGTVSDVGFVAAAGLLPTVVFLLFGGVLADRLPRQHVMVAANIGQGLAQAGFAVLVLTGHAQVWEMMLLTAARGSASGCTCPPRKGFFRRRWTPTSSPLQMLCGASASTAPRSAAPRLAGSSSLQSVRAGTRRRREQLFRRRCVSRGDALHQPSADRSLWRHQRAARRVARLSPHDAGFG